MNQPTPAIVPQTAVGPLARWALLLLCAAYVIPGFVGRAPWKSGDIAAFGYMLELAQGHSQWLAPLLGGMAPETDGLLPYWLGAWALQAAPHWVSPEMAVRLPFMSLLAMALAATWHGIYYLARSPGAQPVAFAFGGEANPKDYARAIADGGLLAFIACLGLAQLSHETTSHLTQLAFTAFIFFGVAASPYGAVMPGCALAIGLVGLTLSGAPAISALLGTGGMLLLWLAPAGLQDHRARGAMVLAMASTLAAGLAWQLELWQWRMSAPPFNLKEWRSLARLFLWFGWPAWPLALWTVWRWRKHIVSRQGYRHLLVPLWFVGISVAAALTTQPADRALLIGLPALAALAAFALPTLSRSVAALIDWFTLLFFSVSALSIWVIWIATQTGVPAKPAANVAKLAPGFVPQFSGVAFLIAIAGTMAWCGLVWWRASRNRAPIWKSLVLPASGATLGWLLLMTLWLPMLDYARSYVPQMRAISAVLGTESGCVQFYGLSRAQIAAVQYHGAYTLKPLAFHAKCDWLIADWDAWAFAKHASGAEEWVHDTTIARPTDKNDYIVLLRRAKPSP